jgi:hypothetical protein
LFSALSGYVTLGTNYNYNQDDGILTLVTKASTDVWGVRSAEYYRKVAFDQPYREVARRWNIFGVTLSIQEIV